MSLGFLLFMIVFVICTFSSDELIFSVILVAVSSIVGACLEVWRLKKSGKWNNWGKWDDPNHRDGYSDDNAHV